ncbi:hypothetical protein JW887_03675 [Candidatus Dojkabacteria bacterium]|nr:hypothetical protein [Candidatus Dojkabacteria bacterium]
MKSINLVECIFSKNYDFESAIICTYGLNLNFFENYLMKLDALYSSDNISIFTDSSTYNSFLHESYTPRWLNKKYLVNHLKTGGVFHAKLYMFASEKKAVVGIGSANITRDGIASNLELLSVFEISEKETLYASLLLDCIDYVRRLAIITNSQSAYEQVELFSETCRSFLSTEVEKHIHFVHNLDRPIIEDLIENASKHRVSKIQVISPFYDVELAALEALRNAFPKSKIEIYIQQKKSNFPKMMFDKIKPNVSLYVYKNIDRYLHGKAILFHCNDEVLLYFGSANFSKSALVEKPPVGNFEIGLLSNIDTENAEHIICPGGKKALLVESAEEIEVSLIDEYEKHHEFIEYITEAILINNIIKIYVNPDITTQQFTPEKIKLCDFDNNTYEENINKDLTIEVTPNIKKRVPGKIAVQIQGCNKKGNALSSNILWVIELEEKSSDPLRKRLRKIYNNPFGLIAVLYEILEGGDENELRLFLMQFDIPLDLVLPPRIHMKPAMLSSKGNIDGALPIHSSFIISSSMRGAYEECLERLRLKLESHQKNPQINKISNFMLILQSLYSLIWFINNESIYNKHKELKIITSDAWALIRDYYNMLLKYIDKSWTIVWSDGGYRDVINAKLAKDQSDNQENDFRNFEQIIAEEYDNPLTDIIKFALHTIGKFEQLKDTLCIHTAYGNNVKPKIFSTNHMYLQFNKVNSIKQSIEWIADSINASGQICR